MKYNLEQAMELTGAVNEEQFLDAFKDKTPEEINEILIYMFGEEGNDIGFAEEIAILAKDNRLKKECLDNLNYPILPYPKGDNKNYKLGEYQKVKLINTITGETLEK